jgi:hypothetical protein
MLLNVAPEWHTYLSRDLYVYLVTYICPTKYSDVGFCPTKFKLCPTKIKSDRTNVLSSEIFICSPATVIILFKVTINILPDDRQIYFLVNLLSS